MSGCGLVIVETASVFELTWEWKVTPGENRGLKYNVSEELSVKEAPNHAALGFEYQILDADRHPDGKLPSHRAGALYDLIAPSVPTHVHPVGEWNQSRLVFKGNHGEHWLNAEKLLESELGAGSMDSARPNRQ